jgi:hypothetical protein
MLASLDAIKALIQPIAVAVINRSAYDTGLTDTREVRNSRRTLKDERVDVFTIRFN